MVALYYGDDAHDNLRAQGIDITKGIAISDDNRFRIFIIEPYLNDFVKAVRRLAGEMEVEDWDPDLAT